MFTVEEAAWREGTTGKVARSGQEADAPRMPRSVRDSPRKTKERGPGMSDPPRQA